MATIARTAELDPKIHSVFEIVGSYFVDTFYNHVYKSARVNLAGRKSLTDEYLRRVQAYVTGVRSDKQCYTEIVQGVHHYFTGMTRFTALSFADFVDRLVKVCAPDSYFRQLTGEDKDELLSSILCDLVANLARTASTPDMLRRIIDEHDHRPELTIRMLQDSAISILAAKRLDILNKFLGKMGQARESVSMDVVEDMKKALRRLVQEKSMAEARAVESENSLAVLKQKYQVLRAREAKLNKLVELLKMGQALGPAAAGASLRVPARDLIAEDPFDFTRVGPQPPPRRERIAEIHADESDEDDGDDVDDGDDGDDGRSQDEEDTNNRRGLARSTNERARRTAKRTPHKPSPITASFFTAGGALPSRGSVRPVAEPLGTVTAAQLGQGPAPTAAAAAPKNRPRPPVLASLLDASVDVENGSLD